MTTLDVEEGGHFIVEEAVAGTVGLNPAAVEDKLGDGALAGVGEDFVGCAGGGVDVDVGVGDGVRGEETLGLAAVAAPGGRVDEESHKSILPRSRGLIWAGAGAGWQLAAGAEEGGEEGAALFGEEAGGDFDLVVELGVVHDAEDRAAGPGLGVRGFGDAGAEVVEVVRRCHAVIRLVRQCLCGHVQ